MANQNNRPADRGRAKDWFVYIEQDMMVCAHHLTRRQAEARLAGITADCPEEARLVKMASVSQDPLKAARIAFGHIANW